MKATVVAIESKLRFHDKHDSVILRLENGEALRFPMEMILGNGTVSLDNEVEVSVNALPKEEKW